MKINQIANEFNKEVEVNFLYFQSFYLKIYFNIIKKSTAVNINHNRSLIQCTKCPNFYFNNKIDENNCNECNNINIIVKNIYSGNLFNINFIKEFLKYLNYSKVNNANIKYFKEYLEDYLNINIKNDNDILYNINLDLLNTFFKIKPISLNILLFALSNKGYLAYKSNINDSAILTNCPMNIIIDFYKLIVIL